MSDTAYYLTHTVTTFLPKLIVIIMMTSLLVGVGVNFIKKL